MVISFISEKRNILIDLFFIILFLLSLHSPFHAINTPKIPFIWIILLLFNRNVDQIMFDKHTRIHRATIVVATEQLPINCEETYDDCTVSGPNLHPFSMYCGIFLVFGQTSLQTKTVGTGNREQSSNNVHYQTNPTKHTIKTFFVINWQLGNVYVFNAPKCNLYFI